jgi:ABC-2 type transport system ATP-binding protein
MVAAALEAIDLHKSYRRGWFGRGRQDALRGVSFRVNQGEIFGLLGQNGAGKTTFIKIVLGIVRRTGGDAKILGLPAGDRRARRRVGYLPENLRVPRHLTALTALEYYGGMSGLSRREVHRRAPEVLEMVGIAHRSRDGVGTYSKGMLQRLGLAQAMLHDPDLFILDEPTDGLDPLARSQVRSYLVDLRSRGKTVFLNSHILQEVELVCDRVAILHEGELRKVGDVRDITREQASVATKFEVSLEFAGEETSLRAALGPRSLMLVATAPGIWSIRMILDNQAEVDRLIDAVRREGVSILHLARRRASLEEAFLHIVSEEQSPPRK